MKKANKILYYVTVTISMLVGLWHFFVPWMFQWYDYLPMQYENLIVGIDYTNYCFSLLLSGLSLMLVLLGRKALSLQKEVIYFYYFLTVVWMFRAALATFIEPWPLEPIPAAAIGQLIASDLLAIIMMITSISFIKALKNYVNSNDRMYEELPDQKKEEKRKMKFENPLLVVTDIDKSVEFYKKVLGLRVVMDFGANKTLTGGLCLQTLETWKEFIGTDNIDFGSNNGEVYFEEDDFDKFADKLSNLNIEYVHEIKEHSWGQRVVRFYDPDKHIIEVGENMKSVCRRFLDSGMTPEQVAVRMDVPMKFVNECIRRI